MFFAFVQNIANFSHLIESYLTDTLLHWVLNSSDFVFHPFNLSVHYMCKVNDASIMLIVCLDFIQFNTS